MTFDMPKAVYCGLALIAAALYFGNGAKPAEANKALNQVHKVSICNENGTGCASIFRSPKDQFGRSIGNRFGIIQ